MMMLIEMSTMMPMTLMLTQMNNNDGGIDNYDDIDAHYNNCLVVIFSLTDLSH